MVTLWDVVSQEAITTFEGASAVLSPDGAILACRSSWNTVTLWEVGTGRQLVTLTVESQLSRMEFSPDGAMLATGEWHGGTITLWDVSEWMGPRPFALEIVSGDGQQGAPGGALAQPLVVKCAISTVISCPMRASPSRSPPGKGNSLTDSRWRTLQPVPTAGRS